jgi:hypothetical protein
MQNVSNHFAGQRKPMNRLTIIFLLGLLACNPKGKGDNPVADQSSIDSAILITDSTTILGERYFGFGTKGPKVIVLNSKGDTVLNQTDLYFEFEFQDFNGDSLDDIVVHRLSNVPAIQDLLLFDKAKKSFLIVNGFDKFPDSKPIHGTDYFYSYHRSGCADNFWDSDLFYIDKFETHLLGNISGNECEGEKGIVVSRVVNGKEKIVDKFPVDVLEKYDDHKWGFIADYWAKNYFKFTK